MSLTDQIAEHERKHRLMRRRWLMGGVSRRALMAWVRAQTQDDYNAASILGRAVRVPARHGRSVS